MKDKKIVMYDSQEAAQVQTVTGWVSNDGRFWGKEEHMARWSGCTHLKCACGNVIDKNYTRCLSCQAQKDLEKFLALPEQEWDGSMPVCIFDDDRYFFDEDDLLDYMADLYDTAKDENAEPEIQLVLCVPGKLHLLSSDDWSDELPEYGELPDEVQKKLDELNDAIRNAAPVCWWPGKTRVNTDELWNKLRKEREDGK